MPQLNPYVLSVDLGQAQDYTAWALCLAVDRPNPEYDAEMAVWSRTHRPPGLQYNVPATFADVHIVDLDRFDLDTPYPAIVGGIQEMVLQPEVQERDVIVAVDAGGPGRPVADTLADDVQGLRGVQRVAPYQITSGHRHHRANRMWNLSRNLLFGEAKKLLSWQQLRVAPELDYAPTFIEELRNFRPKFTSAGNIVYGLQREGENDDLALAAICGIWAAQAFGSSAGPVASIPGFLNRGRPYANQ